MPGTNQHVGSWCWDGVFKWILVPSSPFGIALLYILLFQNFLSQPVLLVVFLEPLSPPWIPRAKISHQSCTFWGWEIYPPLALMGNNPGMEYQAQEQPLHKGIAPPIKIMVWRLPCPCLMQFFVVVFASTRMTQSTMDLCIRDTNYIKNGTKKFHVYFTSSKTARIVI